MDALPLPPCGREGAQAALLIYWHYVDPLRGLARHGALPTHAQTLEQAGNVTDGIDGCAHLQTSWYVMACRMQCWRARTSSYFS